MIALGDTGDLLHVPAAAIRHRRGGDGAPPERRSRRWAQSATNRSRPSSTVSPPGCGDADVIGHVLTANRADVEAAERSGRSTTRLVLTDRMRSDMVAGLIGWRDSPLRRDARVATVEHDGWRVDARRAPLGVVGFVFEGRPNVFADAAGVVRSGNTVVMRIGSDALATAEAIVEGCVVPALAAAGLPAAHDRADRFARSGRPAGRCSPNRGSRSPWPAARARRWPSSAPSPASAARRSASTAPGERGWSPAGTPTPAGSPRA